MTAVVLVVLLVVAVAACRGTQRWTSGAQPACEGRSDVRAVRQRREADRARRREQARQRRLPPLPADDVPPAGLAPLVPSPRTMRVEAARGIREIEDWLERRASA